MLNQGEFMLELFQQALEPVAASKALVQPAKDTAAKGAASTAAIQPANVTTAEGAASTAAAQPAKDTAAKGAASAAAAQPAKDTAAKGAASTAAAQPAKDTAAKGAASTAAAQPAKDTAAEGAASTAAIQPAKDTAAKGAAITTAVQPAKDTTAEVAASKGLVQQAKDAAAEVAASKGLVQPAKDTAAEGAASQKRKRGAPGLYELFPEIPVEALKIVQLKGSGAQNRRRDGTCDADGVEASHLRDHLMNKVPGLREFLITKRLRGGESIEVAAQAQMHVTQAQELFMLPNKSRNRSARYHSTIPARVPPKSNRESKESEDFQVTAAQVQHG